MMGLELLFIELISKCNKKMIFVLPNIVKKKRIIYAYDGFSISHISAIEILVFNTVFRSH